MAKELVETWRAGLNPEQERAATHPGGPLLIVAGAGTGKTKTLACRVAHLIGTGVPAERILLLTFTRRAAAEMLKRAGQMSSGSSNWHRSTRQFSDPSSGGAAAAQVWGGTFHAVSNRLLRMHGRALGLDANFTVMDQADGADLMDLIRDEGGYAKGKKRFPKKDTLAAIYSRAVNSGEKLVDVLERHFPWCKPEVEGVREILSAYVERKRGAGVLDYDDLLLFWKALAEAPGVGELVAERFDHILVDEYQDTNHLQSDVLRAMRKTNNNITVVGDDAQAIYSFRAASIDNILSFPDHFPGAEIVKLERNYRSTAEILATSNAVMAESPLGYGKALWTERTDGRRPALIDCLDEEQQTHQVCERVLEHRERGVALKSQAVLFRAGHHSALLEIELTRRNIPFVKYGGLKFVESAHVKDVVAFLRILENPRDELGWWRVFNLLDGVGPATARALMMAIGVTSGSSDISPLVRFAEDMPSPGGAGREQVAALAATLSECGKESPALPVAGQIEVIRRFYEPIVHRRYEAPHARIRDLEQLEALASSSKSRERFVVDLTLDPPASTQDLAGPPLLDEDFLILSTVHSAKGGEWDVVHVLHAADGMIPSDMATGDADEIEEERRLFYVALTRAKNDLYVYFPLRYYHRPRGLDDAHGYAQLSRFITESVKETFDLRPAFTGSPEDDARVDHAPVAQVTKYLSDLFSI